jgi:predicted Zn finger-like uncharacterized protein
LFTQCSKCETVFKLSADTLRSAGGQVRCGRCGEVFNALARLAEQPAAFAIGESPLELEARADRILQTTVKEKPREQAPANEIEELGSSGVEIARLEVQWPGDPRDSEDSELEFSLPPGELDRIFIANKQTGRREAVPVNPVRSTAPEPAGRSPTPTAIGLEISESARRALLEGGTPAEDGIPVVPEADLLPTRPARPKAIWVVAAVLLALLLGAQLVHSNRQQLAANPAFGGVLRSLYAKLGYPVPVPANLSSYELRQWGVTGDPGANGTLRVRASILNTAADFQAYPLLRVTLTNRFGVRLGTREFDAAQYLAKPTVGMLAPGERADATVSIQDPGKDAEGFEIDVCLRGADHALTCANDTAAHAP